MLVTNYNLFHGLKSKDSEELILNLRLAEEVKFRKRKFSITENKNLSKVKFGFATKLS